MPQPTRSKTREKAFDPVFNISTIFTVRRDLRPYARETLGNSGLSVEEADILIYLMGALEYGWEEVPADREGFVALRDLKEALVHDPSLFARRLKKLAAGERPLIEVRRVSKRTHSDLHGNSQQARITKAGVGVTVPIWDNFRRLSAKLLAGLPQADLEAHLRVNEAITRRLRQLRDPAKQLISNR